MKIQSFVLVLLCTASGLVSAQSRLFTKTIGGDNDDLAMCIRQTPDGGYIIAGYTKSFGAGKYDIYLVKTDPAGNLLWQKTYGGGENDYGNFVIQTKDGGYVLTGSTESIPPEGFEPGPAYAILIKTDARGKELWSRSFGQGTTDVGHCVVEKEDGGFIVLGGSGSYGTSFDMIVMETDAEGNTMYRRTKKSGKISISGVGGKGTDVGYDMEKIRGHYMLVGETSPPESEKTDIYLVKMKVDFQADKTAVVWEKVLPGEGSSEGRAIRQTADGGFIIAGNAGKTDGEKKVYDIICVKTDSGGGQEWSKTFGGTDNDMAYDIEAAFDGCYVIAGRTYSFGKGKSDMYLIKTDEKGTERWSKTFGGTGYDGARSVCQTVDMGLVIAGYSVAAGRDDADIFIVKTDYRGEIEAKKREYSREDFFVAARNGDLERMTAYIGDKADFILMTFEESSGPRQMQKNKIIDLFRGLLKGDPASWKYYPKSDTPDIRYDGGSSGFIQFTFVEKNGKPILDSILQYISGGL